MKKWKRMTAWLMAACMLLSVLTGCANTENKKDTLHVSLPAQLSTLDPAHVTTDTEKMVVSHLYENLMKLTADGAGGVTAVGGIASSYQCEEALDGTQTYTFTLRKGVRWSDGRELTAADFVYAWKRLADPDTGSPNATLLNMVAGYDRVRSSGDGDYLQVSAPDNYTFVVTLSHRSTFFISRICTAAATMPVRSDVSGKDGWSMDVATLRTNGAYHVTMWEEGGTITATVPEHYYDAQRLGPDELVISFHEDSVAAEKKLKDGDADFVLGLNDAALSEKDDKWSVDPYPTVGMLVVNQMAGNASSENLRLAMSMVIDRNAIVQTMGEQRYSPAEGLVPPGVYDSSGGIFRTKEAAFFDNDSNHYETVCKKAKELLKADQSWNGTQLRLSYIDSDVNRAVVNGMVKTWKEQLGVTVTPVGMTASELNNELNHGDFTIAMVSQYSGLGDAEGFLKYWRSGNYAYINNNAYDLLLRISDVSSGVVARDAYLHDAENLLIESGYVMPLWFGSTVYQLDKNLSGLGYDGNGCYIFTSVTKKN